ncbi:GGDEF domain-containing protein [Paenibacillus dakarensis]|uniref:GGDEF domain-containing protein n=1 Tax=Paenibacillus dakarensis TaxID=1527293 RepID=UPI0006D562CA|nr:GGDEF domain-containing protein [Paenibacillus dakarensis]
MNKLQWIEIHRRPWNRKIMNSYWIVILISLITQFTALFIINGNSPPGLDAQSIYPMLFLFALQLSLMTSIEIIIRWLDRESPYLMILTGTLLASILIADYPAVEGIEYLMVLPIIVSLFYDEYRKLIFAFSSAAMLLTILSFTSPTLFKYAPTSELITYLFTMLGVFIIFCALIKQRRELLAYLNKSIQSAQDLLIRSVIMDRQIKFDALTDLYNHKTFHEYLDNLIVQSDKYGLPLQLAIIDIDNFKKVNDTFGHAVGDLILQRVSQVVKQSMPSPDDITARFGGEEFAVIFTDKTLAQAFDTIERIRLEIERMHHPEMNSRNVTVSIGLASYRYRTGKAAIFAEADAMLYTAKRSGKNQTITTLKDPAAV